MGERLVRRVSPVHVHSEQVPDEVLGVLRDVPPVLVVELRPQEAGEEKGGVSAGCQRCVSGVCQREEGCRVGTGGGERHTSYCPLRIFRKSADWLSSWKGG